MYCTDYGEAYLPTYHCFHGLAVPWYFLIREGWWGGAETRRGYHPDWKGVEQANLTRAAWKHRVGFDHWGTIRPGI